MTTPMTDPPGPAARPAPILTVDGLRVTYSNGATGVAGISLTVAPGEIVALLGRNGAGKSSTLGGIAGFLRSERVSVDGTVAFHGHDLAGAPPSRTHKRGIALVQERSKVFADLTVEDHLRLMSATTPASAPCTFEALERLRGSLGGLLSGGERQMLALEVALRGTPRVLLIDELSLGLAPVIVHDLMARVRALASEAGVAVVLVEQDAPAALAIADWVYVLRDGGVAWSGPSSATSAEAVSRQYLGTVAS